MAGLAARASAIEPLGFDVEILGLDCRCAAVASIGELTGCGVRGWDGSSKHTSAVEDVSFHFGAKGRDLVGLAEDAETKPRYALTETKQLGGVLQLLLVLRRTTRTAQSGVAEETKKGPGGSSFCVAAMTHGEEWLLFGRGSSAKGADYVGSRVHDFNVATGGALLSRRLRNVLNDGSSNLRCEHSGVIDVTREVWVTLEVESAANHSSQSGAG